MKSFEDAARNFKNDRDTYFKSRYGSVCREILDSEESAAMIASMIEVTTDHPELLLGLLQLGVCIGIEMRGGIQIQ